MVLFSTVQELGLDALTTQRLFKEGGMKDLGMGCSSYPLLCNKLSQTY